MGFCKISLYTRGLDTLCLTFLILLTFPVIAEHSTTGLFYIAKRNTHKSLY